jgi:hypothetical protein
MEKITIEEARRQAKAYREKKKRKAKLQPIYSAKAPRLEAKKSG